MLCGIILSVQSSCSKLTDTLVTTQFILSVIQLVLMWISCAVLVAIFIDHLSWAYSHAVALRASGLRGIIRSVYSDIFGFCVCRPWRVVLERHRGRCHFFHHVCSVIIIIFTKVSWGLNIVLSWCLALRIFLRGIGLSLIGLYTLVWLAKARGDL